MKIGGRGVTAPQVLSKWRKEWQASRRRSAIRFIVWLDLSLVCPTRHYRVRQPVPTNICDDSLVHFRPSFLPAASSAIDSRIRLSRVSGRRAVWIHATKFRRSRPESDWKYFQALRLVLNAVAT